MEETVNFTTKTSRWSAVGFLGSRWMIFHLVLIVLAAAYWIAAANVDAVPEFDVVNLVVYGLIALYVLLFLLALAGVKRERVEILDYRMFIYRRIGCSRTRIAVPHKSIVSFEVHRTFLGCLFRFGTITFFLAGGGRIKLERIAKLHKLQQAFYPQLLEKWVK